MKLLNLKIKNFLSYSDADISFSKGLYLLEGWNCDEDTANGAGKSAIMDAICYAIYGETSRDVKIDELTSWNSDNKQSVEVTFLINSDIYQIVRTRKPNNISFSINGNVIVGADNKSIQAEIIKVIGLSKDSFLRVVYFRQDLSLKDTFLFANDVSKKEILTEILELEIFDKCCDDSKESLKKTQLKLVTLQEEERQIGIRLNDKLSNRGRLEAYSASFDKDKEEDLKRLNNSLALLANDLQDHKKNSFDVSSREANLKQLDMAISLLKEDEKDLSYQIETLSNSLKGEKENLYSVKASIEALQLNRKKIETFKDQCPTCEQKIDQVFMNAKLSEVDGVFEIKKLALEHAEEVILLESKKISLLNSDLDRVKKTLFANEIEKNTCIKSIESDKALYANKLNSLNSSVEDLKNQIRIVSNKENTYQNLILIENDEIEKIEKNIIEVEEKISVLVKMQDALEFLIMAFGRSGIKSMVFSAALKELELWVNEYASEIFKEDVRVLISQMGEGIRAGIFVSVIWNGQEVNLNLLSGGQKRRLILATDFALSKLVSSRAKHIPNFLCMDECFNWLDLNGKEKIMFFLDQLKIEKDFIWVVDHNSEFQSSFDGTYKIEKTNGISRFFGDGS